VRGTVGFARTATDEGRRHRVRQGFRSCGVEGVFYLVAALGEVAVAVGRNAAAAFSSYRGFVIGSSADG